MSGVVISIQEFNLIIENSNTNKIQDTHMNLAQQVNNNR